ncbi:hypothetical protein ABGV43_02700 [Paenibacillus amylolyticus]|uniref:hypothetical protein n=1 Tax=Paenibacillus amylolyticus TaxID=1451 RepID=UPI003241DC40
MKLARTNFQLTDHFFAYADNSLCNFSLNDFKALLNFYLIFQDKLIIPDSFLINNPHLFSLFNSGEDSYIQAIKKGIILPAIRGEISSLIELHEQFHKKGDTPSTVQYIANIDSVSKNKAINWGLKEVETQFTHGVLNILNSAAEYDPNLEAFLNQGLKHDILNIRETKGSLNRLDIMKTVNEKYKLQNIEAATLFIGLITAKYQTTIPDLLNIEIAYPQLKQNYVNNRDLIKESRLKKQHNIHNVEVIYDHFDTLLFDTTLLSQLNFKEIIQIRKLNEYKQFIKALNGYLNNSISDNSLVLKFDQYNKELQKTLRLMIDKDNYQYYLKRKKQMKIMKYTTTGLSVANTFINFLPIPGVNYLNAALDLTEKLFEKSVSTVEKNHERLTDIHSAAGLEIINTFKSGIHINKLTGTSSLRIGE